MRVSIVLLLALLLPAWARGQEEGLEAFGEVIDVRVLNLEVAVHDKDGYHVPDLRPSDFRLTVDGSVIPIEYFSEIRGGRAADAPIDAPGAAAPAVATVPTVRPGQAVGTSFLLFIDNYFGHARDRRIVLEQIIDTLPRLGPRDRMAVVAFDGTELELVGNWESDPGKIARTLREAIVAPAAGLKRRAELGTYALQLRSRGSGLIQESLDNTRVQYIRVLSEQVEKVVKAATAALRALASPPGRKVMLLTSGGWPDDPSIYAVGLDPDIRYRTKRFSPRKAFEDLAGTANLLGYTIYPIDLPGRQNAQRVDAANLEATGVDFTQPAPTTVPDGPPGLAALTEPGPTPEEATIAGMNAVFAEFEQVAGREQLVEGALIRLARDTGGEAMLNSFRSQALPRTLEDTGSYYWLGYTPTWARDDREHRVKVEVLRPGLKSRSRRSFKDLSRQAEVTMMVESNLLFSSYLGDDSLAVELGEPKKKRGKIELPVSLKIPMDPLVMLPVAGGFEANLELRVAVLDEKGARSEIPVIPVKLGGETRPPPGAHAIYDTQLVLRNISQRLALALYDLAGEKILSTSIEFDPEKS